MPDDIGNAEASRRGNGAGDGTPAEASRSTTGAGGAAPGTGDTAAGDAGGRSEAHAAGGGLSGPAAGTGRRAADPGGTGASKGQAKATARPADAGAQPPAATGGAEQTTDDAALGQESPPDKPSAAHRFRQGVSRVLGLAPSARPAERTLAAGQINEFRALALEEATSEDVSEELSIALGLAQRIRQRGCAVDSAYDRLRFIFECLLADPPKLILARDERLRLQVEVYQQSGWISRTLARISSGSPVALVLTALGASLIIWAVVFLVIRWLSGLGHAPAIFFMDGQALGIVAFAALVGGIVSIATRLREFSRVRDLDPFAMFWTALLKPLIGVVLAAFILATLAGDVVSLGFLGSDPLGIADGAPAVAAKTWYILWVLGFLAGFSERFAWDFVDRARGVANGGAGAATPTAQS